MKAMFEVEMHSGRKDPINAWLTLRFFRLYLVTLSLLSQNRHQVRGEKRTKIAAVISITQMYFSSDEDLSCLSLG